MKRDSYSKDSAQARDLLMKLSSDSQAAGRTIRRLVRRCRTSERTIATLERIIDEREERAAAAREAGKGLCAWLDSRDTGLSSIAMARRLAPLAGLDVHVTCHPQDATNYPLDPADFGRCYRLLLAVPALRPHIAHMAAVNRRWATLADAWGELEALYREEQHRPTAPKLYARMKALGV